MNTSTASTAAHHRPDVVRLSGPEGIVAAVPQCLGFKPADSIVLMCFSGPRDRVGPVARVDLFPPGCVDPAAELTSFALRYADSVTVVCYHTGPRPRCLDDILTSLRRAHVPIMTVLSVASGRIRPAGTVAEFDDDPGIVSRGDDDPQARTLAAATVMSGRHVLGSREELADSVAGPVGAARRHARAAVTRTLDTLPPFPDRRDSPPGPALAELVDRALADADHQHTTTGTVSPDNAARLIALSICIGCRDRIMGFATGYASEDVVGMLVAVAQHCPDEYAAEWCSVLAVAAYRFGDGALAHCALDRTFAARTDHRLGRLVLDAILAGLPPDSFATLGTRDAEDGQT